MTLVGIIIIAVFAFVLVRRAVAGNARQARRDLLHAAAAEAGLAVFSSRTRWGMELPRLELQGERDGVLLRFVEEPLGRGRVRCTFIAIGARAGLRLDRRHPVFEVTEPVTGNELFDRYLTVPSGIEQALPVLNAVTRHQLYLLRAGENHHDGPLLQDGILTVTRPYPLPERELGEWAARLVELCRRLALPADWRAALMSSVRSDPDREVRVRMLDQLWRSFPEDEEVLALIGERLQAGDPLEVLELSCRFPGAKSEEALCRILDAADGPGNIPGARGRALEALVRLRPGPDLSARVIAALASSERPLRSAAISAVRKLELRAAADALCNLVFAADDLQKVTALEVLEFLGDSRAERVAISLLDSRSPSVQCAAARVLRQVGTVQAVGALAPLAGAFEAQRGVHEEALAAIRAIQARLGLHGQGGLRLVESGPATGAVAVATQPGALAMSERGGPPAC